MATLPMIVAPDGFITDGDWVESKDQDPDGTVRLTQLADIGDGFFRNRSKRFLRTDQADRLRCTFLNLDDVLIARMPEPLGRACLYPGGSQPAVTAVDVCIVRLGTTRISARWLVHFVNAPQFRHAIAAEQRGSTRKRVSKKSLCELRMPVPPSQEQTRIADEIDAHLTRLDDAVASLERAQTKLKAYRASVLKAAVEGRLVPTAASLARAEKRDYEPADVLLARILNERRRRWEEAELARLKAAGKTPKDDKWKARYEEPAAPDTAGLPELPEGWCWGSCDQLLLRLQTGPFGSSLHKSDYVVDGTPVVNPEHLRGFGIRPSARVTVDQKTAARLSMFRLKRDDIVLGRRGEMGRSAVVGHREEGWILGTGSLALRAAGGVQPQFLAWVLRSPRVVRTLEGESVGTTMTNLNQRILLGLPIPLPSKAEQMRIVQEIERQLSVVEALADDAATQQSRCGCMRQAVLKWAFEGKLADQDPNDEPADKLLARIRAERAAAVPAPKATRRRGEGAA